MATTDLSAQETLLNLAKSTNNKELIYIAGVLDKRKPLFKDAIFVEANQLTGHVFAQDAELPSGTWREINEGVTPGAGSVQQVTEGIGLLEAHSKIDEYLVDLAPNPKAYLLQKEKSFIEGLGQDFATAFWYQNLADDPAAIHGMSLRYNAPSTQANVWDCGHTTDAACSSIWLIQWGTDRVHLIYPRNSKTMGIQRVYHGKVLVTDSGGSAQFVAHFTQYKFNVGIVVHDNRCVQRIGSIAATGTASIVDPDLIIKAKNSMLNQGAGAVLYCSQAIKSQLEINAKDKPNVWYYAKDPYGTGMEGVLGMPIHVDEQISDVENDI